MLRLVENGMDDGGFAAQRLEWLKGERASMERRGVPVPRWVAEGIADIEAFLARDAEDAREVARAAPDDGKPAAWVARLLVSLLSFLAGAGILLAVLYLMSLLQGWSK